LNLKDLYILWKQTKTILEKVKQLSKQTKIIFVIVLILILIVAIGGYYGYQRYNLNARVQESDKMMKANGIKQPSADKVIVDDILKNNSTLQYAYISHSGKTVMLTLKFNKGIQDKVKSANVSKYMDTVRAQYKGTNVNATVIPTN